MQPSFPIGRCGILLPAKQLRSRSRQDATFGGTQEHQQEAPSLKTEANAFSAGFGSWAALNPTESWVHTRPLVHILPLGFFDEFMTMWMSLKALQKHITYADYLWNWGQTKSINYAFLSHVSLLASLDLQWRPRFSFPLPISVPNIPFIIFLFFIPLAEVAEELGRTASSSSIVPYLPRLPMLPSKTRTLKKQAENKENIEGTQDPAEHSASSSAPGTGTGTVAMRPPALGQGCCWCKWPEKQKKTDQCDVGRCSVLLCH